MAYPETGGWAGLWFVPRLAAQQDL